MDVVETDGTEKPIETQTLDLPAKILADYDNEDDVWSWGLSPRVVALPNRAPHVQTVVPKVGSRLSTVQSERIKPDENISANFDPDLILQVVKCADVPEREPRPKTPATRMLSGPIRQEPVKPDKTFITNPGTFFATESQEKTSSGEPVAAVVRREVSAPPSSCKPRTVATLNHNKTLVVRADNEQKKPKLALVRDLDNTTKPTFTARKPKEVPKISEPKKFKSVPFQIPELSSKLKKNILTLPADKGSKLELLQKRLKYDARKYAKCNIKTGSSSSESSEEDVEDEDSSDNEPSPPPRMCKEREAALEKLQDSIICNVPNIPLNKNFYFHQSSLTGTRIKLELDELVPHKTHHLKVFMDSSGKRRFTETPSRANYLREIRRKSFLGCKMRRKESLVQGYQERRQSGLTVDSHSSTSRSNFGKLGLTGVELKTLRGIAEKKEKREEEEEEKREEEKEEEGKDGAVSSESSDASFQEQNNFLSPFTPRRPSQLSIGSVAARQSWAKGTNQITKKRPAVSYFEESLSDADKSIIANLEAGDSLSRSTPVTTDPQGGPTPLLGLGDHVGDSDDGDTSDVSVTAEDLELFDRWVEGDTPTSKDVESDRAASIEIQQVLGIDHVTYTPPQLQRIRSAEASRNPSMSETTSVAIQETEAVEEEGEIEPEEDVSEDKEQELSLMEFVSEKSGEEDLLHLDFQAEHPPSLGPDDREELERDLNFTEPTYEDVLNVSGKNLNISTRKALEDDVVDLQEETQTAEPDVTLLSTWAPDTQDPASHFSVHHFCTLAVRPQLPRVLHNITRSAHFQGLPVSVQDIRSETSLSWFEETPRDNTQDEQTVGADGELDMEIQGARVPEIKDKQLYWTPAPPKMDLPPLFIKTHLFPKYESAIASAEQQALLNQVELVESSTSEEETVSDETDEEDRALRRRVLTRRHGSSQSVTRNKPVMEQLGPDKIKLRNRRLRRPGSAPILTESEPHSRYKSDYYTSYGEIEDYHTNMVEVQNKLKEEESLQHKRLTRQDTRKADAPEKYSQLVRPYLNTPISEKGMLSLSPSYSKLLPITRVVLKTKITKKELTDVKECLVQCRKLKRTTSCPCVLEQFELKKRAGSCTDLSKIESEWDDYQNAATDLRETNLPVFAHKLGTLLSKDIVLLHQIIKKDNPVLYSDLLNEVHRLSNEIQKGMDYLYYNKARRGALYVKLGMFKDARADLDSVVEAMPQMADAYWHRHLIHVIQGDMNTALNDLTNIIRHNQNQPRVYLARAEIYQKQGDITGAILNYSQALKRDSSNAETYYKRAALFEEKGDILLALEDYTIANKLCPSNTVAILKKGKYNFERGAYSVAVADFTAMLEQEPYNSIARTYRGRAYAKMGKYTSALEDLSCAIHLDPGNHLPFYHRAVLLRKENPKRSLQDFSVSILLNSTVENKKAFLHRGILYADLHRYEEAVPDFEAVVELDWNSVEAHINLGLICQLNLKQYKRAIRCFAAAIDVDPTKDRAYVCRGDAYKAIKKYNLALIDYTRAIHIRPNIGRYYLYRGKLLLEMGNLDQAAQHIRFASVLTKDTDGTGPAALQKAVVQSFLHNYDDAIFVLDRAAGLDPSPSQYILLGKTYLKAKRYGEAVDNFEKALMYLNPKILKQEMPKSAAEVYFLIGKCHVESGNYPSALDALNSAIRINPAYSEAYFQRGLVRIWVKSQRPLLDFNRALAYNPNYFQAYLTRAAYFGMKGRYSKAMFNCNEALKIQPKSVRAYLYRGALKFEIKNYALAVEDLSAAIKLDPLCSIAYYNRAVCYQYLEKKKEALCNYGIVLLLEKELNQRVLLNRGLLYYQSEDYDNALVDFKLAVSDAPDNALLYHTLGLCYHRNNQLSKALSSLSHAMTLKEHFIQAYVSRGNVYMSLNTERGYKMSKRDYCRALHYNPTNLTAHVNLGIALQSYGKMNEGWKQFTAAIKIDPNCHLALEARSIVNLQMGHLFGAFCDINSAVELHPTPTMLTNRGVVQQYMNDPANAMKDFQQAIEADPTYSLAYFNAANLYFNMRLFEKALKYYDAAVKNCVDDEGAVLNRAIAKVLLKDNAGALADFDAAISLNPFAAHSYFNRGNLHLAMGENAKAEEDYRKALSLQPKDSSSYSQLAVALGRQFKKVEALDNYKRAIKLNER